MGRLGFTYLTSLGMALYPAAGFGRAQAPPPRPIIMQRPTVSPYLNLARGGSPGLNYYNLVRPQTEFRDAVQRLQQEQATNQQNISGLDAALTMPGTGHATRFMDYSRYFMSQGGSSAGRPPQTAAPIRPAQRPSPPR